MVVKIQSFSDVITNSSSEIFVTKGDPSNEFSDSSNGFILVVPITRNWLDRYWDSQQELICGAVSGFSEYSYYSWKDWESLKDLLLDRATEALDGYYYVDIEDHYAEYREDGDIARQYSIYEESLH